MSTSSLVRPGGLAAIVAGVLLLILDVWSLLMEILGAYPENFSEEALTANYMFGAVLWLLGGLLLLVAMVGLYVR